MKLTLNLSDDLARRIRGRARQKGRNAMEAFVQQAVRKELERIEGSYLPQDACDELAALALQMRNLREGQRGLAALIDSAATALATASRRPRSRSGKDS